MFVGQLFDEAEVFFHLHDHVFEGIELLGDGVRDGVDHAAGAFAEEIEDLVAVEVARRCGSGPVAGWAIK